MSKRNNHAHSSIYEEFEVSFSVIDLFIMQMSEDPEIVTVKDPPLPSPRFAAFKDVNEISLTTYSLNKTCYVVYQHPLLEALLCGFQLTIYFTLITSQKFMT